MVRKFLAFALVAVLALVLLPRLFKHYPSDAMINAPIVDIRSPLEAVVTQVVAGSSGLYEEDVREVVVLKTRFADQKQALQVQERILALRAQRFIHEEKTRLQLELVTRERELQRAELDVAASEREVKRQRSLTEQGFISPAQLDDATLRHARNQAQRDIAGANVTRAQANLKALVKNGFLGEQSGGTDVSYTQQRLDEVRLRISELDSWPLGARAATAGAGAGEDAARPPAAIRTPGQGLLMGPFVTEGAFLAAGDLIAHYVLCRQAFVDMSVRIADLKDYRIGEPVQFRVAGEWDFHEGTITQVHPLPVSGSKNAVAVRTDAAERLGLAHIRVQPNAHFADRIRQEPNCMVGHKVHAQRPSGSGWIKRSLSFLADVF